MPPSPATRFDRPQRWVIPELDVDGRIDAHAALCLRIAIGGAWENGAERILVDLRELTTIEPAAVALFVRHDADCLAAGVQLGLLIRAEARQDAIAGALSAAGLGDRLQFGWQSPAPPPPTRPARPVIVRPRARRATAHR